MDSPTEALLYLFVYTPLRYVSKFMEILGIIYGLCKHPFQIGEYKASKVYDKFKGD